MTKPAPYLPADAPRCPCGRPLAPADLVNGLLSCSRCRGVLGPGRRQCRNRGLEAWLEREVSWTPEPTKEETRCQPR